MKQGFSHINNIAFIYHAIPLSETIILLGVAHATITKKELLKKDNLN